MALFSIVASVMRIPSVHSATNCCNSSPRLVFGRSCVCPRREERELWNGASDGIHRLELPFLILLSEHSLNLVFLGVLSRNRKSLKLLCNWCRPTTTKGQRSLRARDQAHLDAASGAALLTTHVRAVAWVRLSLLSKGRPELHAQVCVATQEDLQRLGNKKEAYSGPLEHPHKDRFKSKVKRCKKGTKKAPPTSSTVLPTLEGPEPHPDTPLAPAACSLHPPSAASGAAVSQTSVGPSCPPAPAEGPSSPTNLVLGLWPDPLPSVTSHCSRVTLGWVTQGDFSLSVGCGEALGLVSLEGLVHTLMAQPAEQRGLVLLRNPSALHYRWAKINIEA